MIEARKYEAQYAALWNAFVATAGNSTFFFHRTFMEYHAERFTDHSVLFFKRHKLVAVLPANIAEKTIYSHAGLSYGGLIYGQNLRLPEIAACFVALSRLAEAAGCTTLCYKAVPTYYHKPFLSADTHLLQKLNARQSVELASVVDLSEQYPFQKRRRRGIKKARKNGLYIEKNSTNWFFFWEILHKNLKNRYRTSPAHSLEEIRKLNHKFPQNIKLRLVKKEEKILAGTVLFLNAQTVHTQYLANTPEGRSVGALDFLISTLFETYNNMRYLSFGINDRRNPQKTINGGLNDWKEGFGARAWTHYRFDLPFTTLNRLDRLFE